MQRDKGKGDAVHTNLYRFRHDNFGKDENETSVGRRRSAWHGMSIDLCQHSPRVWTGVCVSDVRLALPSAFHGFSAAPFSVSFFFRSHASASVTANIQRVEREGAARRGQTGGDAICAAHSGRAASERGGAGRRQPERVLFRAGYGASLVWFGPA